MIKKILLKLLGQKLGHHGKPYYKRHSSDDYPRHGRGPHSGSHNQYGSGYYHKRRGSGSYSS